MMFEIAGRPVGMGHAPIISAELGISHNADLNTALKMIDSAAECGADGVKVQYFSADDFSSPDNGKTVTYKQLSRTGSGCFDEITEPEYVFFKRHEIDLAFVKECWSHAKKHDLIFGVTTTSVEGVKQVASMTDYFKIASDMIDKSEMIDEMRKTGLPIIVSTGHMTIEELPEFGRFNTDCMFLHCESQYPCENPKLWRIKHMQEMGYLTGYSDHTIGNEACIRAAELGAVFLEVHFTLEKTMPGSDHWWSLDPAELRELVKAIK